MRPRTPRWLNDNVSECALIRSATAGRSIEDYLGDPVLQHAVERCFEIIGEAMLRIERTDPGVASRFTDHRKIIGFRNRLAHGYDDVKDDQVWLIIKEYLPTPDSEARQLLDAAEEG